MSRSGHRTPGRRETERAERRRRARVRRRVVVGAGIAAAGVLVAGVVAVGIVTAGPALSGNTSATAWDLPALGDPGARVALADFRGKPTVAVFFASWCEVCEHEIPGFVALSDQLGDAVNWVGINSQDHGRGMGDATRWGIDTRWPLARDVDFGDGRGLATGTFSARGMPLTVIYDEAGAVVHVQLGGISADGLLGLLDRAFGIAST